MVSSDARARASRSASAIEPLPRGKPDDAGGEDEGEEQLWLLRGWNRIPSMKSLSANYKDRLLRGRVEMS